eukprot:6116873-Amphidinium_carterae.2
MKSRCNLHSSSKRTLPQQSTHSLEDDKGTLRATHITQTMARTLEHNLTTTKLLGFKKLEIRRTCAFANKQSTIYIMAYVDGLVVGNNTTTPQFLQQFQQHLELKHTSQLTTTTPLEFLGKTIELHQDVTIHLSFAPQYYHKILKTYTMDKCNPATTPGNKKPPIAAQPLNKEQHSMFRTAVGQLLWVLTIKNGHFVCGEGAQSLQQPDN